MKQQLSYNAKEASSDEEVVRASPHRKKWQGRRRKADLLRWLGGGRGQDCGGGGGGGGRANKERLGLR